MHHKSVVRMKADEFEITSDQLPKSMTESYVDGEHGPGMPLKFRVHKNALQVITNRECSTWNIPRIPHREMFHVEQ